MATDLEVKEVNITVKKVAVKNRFHGSRDFAFGLRLAAFEAFRLLTFSCGGISLADYVLLLLRLSGF